MKYQPTKVTLKNSDTVEIREGKSSDAAELIQVMKDILHDTEFLLMEEEEFNMTLEEETQWLKAFEHTPTSIYLVATYNGKIVGNLGIVGNQLKKQAHTASLGISLLKEWQNIGLGRALMQQAIDWAKEKTDLEILWLEVFSHNIHAYSLYEKLGFKEEGRLRNFYKLKSLGYSDKIIMTLALR